MQESSRSAATLRRLVKALRRRTTPAEQKLWRTLKNRNFMGLKFRRHEAIGPYLVDFYCHEHGLIVELDADAPGVHVEPADTERDGFFAAHGLTVVRVSPEEVLSGSHEALMRLVRGLASRHAPAPQAEARVFTLPPPVRADPVRVEPWEEWTKYSGRT